MSGAASTLIGRCIGVPEHFDNADGVKVAAVTCGQEIQQTPPEPPFTLPSPMRCPSCDAAIEAIGRARLQYFAESEKRVRDRELRASMERSGLRPEVIDGRITLDRLPDLYGETRTAGGVTPERYREIATLVKDFVSVPALLRTGSVASILLLHGEKGTGKTWLLEAAIGYVARELGRSAIFTSPMKMWADIKAAYGDDKEKSEARVVAEHVDANVLGVDDLARKTSPTDWEIATLLQIIDERYRQNRVTLLSSNYDVKGLFELWSDASDPRKTQNVELLADRLADRKAAISITMSGKSLRRER